MATPVGTPLGVTASHRSKPPFTGPGSIPGLRVHLDASDASTFTYSSGVVVSQWRDKSGGGNHATQATVSLQPARSGLRNGKPTVIFDGTWMQATCTPPIGATNQAFSIFATVIRTGASLVYETFVTLTTGAAGEPWDRWNDQILGIDAFNGGTGTVPNLQTGFTAWSSWSVRSARNLPVPAFVGQYEERVNAVTQWSSNVTNNTTYNTGTGQRVMIAARGDFAVLLRGEIGEMIIYDRRVTDLELADIETYLKTKWGTP